MGFTFGRCFFIQRSVFGAFGLLGVLVFVWVAHEINQVGIVVLNRINVQKNVLRAKRAIFLLLLNHLLVALASCVVVRILWLDLNLSGRVLGDWLFDTVLAV